MNATTTDRKAQTTTERPPSPLDYCPLIRDAATDVEAMEGHHGYHQRIDRAYAAFLAFLPAIYACNGHTGTPKAHRTRIPSVRTPETADLPLPEMKLQLAADIKARWDTYRADRRITLEGLLRACKVGVIEFGKKRTNAFFTFYRSTSVVENGAWKRLSGIKSREVVEKSHHTRHMHSLMGVTVHPFPGEAVDQPSRVRRLLAAVPADERDEIQVIDGTLIAMDVRPWTEEVGRRTETVVEPAFTPSVQTRDPGVVLDGYVLTGWLPDEVEAEVAAAEARDQAAWQELARRQEASRAEEERREAADQEAAAARNRTVTAWVLGLCALLVPWVVVLFHQGTWGTFGGGCALACGLEVLAGVFYLLPEETKQQLLGPR